MEKQLEESYQRLLTGNKNWVDRVNKENPTFFKTLEKGQSPEFLWIGCADSRVPANEITDTFSGEIFVHRNIANLVIHTDYNLLSVLQYAVEVLKVKHIIVCGHYGCGGVLTALENTNVGMVDNWIRNIKDVYQKNIDELSKITDKQALANRMVELNVVEQVKNLSKNAIIQKAWKKHSLQIHGWVYSVGDGIIKDLNVMVKELDDLEPIYRYNI